jgi:hypothetical protein
MGDLDTYKVALKLNLIKAGYKRFARIHVSQKREGRQNVKDAVLKLRVK